MIGYNDGMHSLQTQQNKDMFENMFKNLNIAVTLLIVIAVIVLIQWRRRRSRSKNQLAHNQRAVYLQRQWLDPVIELLIVGGVIWSDLQNGWLPWLMVLLGIVVGLPIGVVRGKYMYVRSVGKGHKIVLERNAVEISIFIVLIAIKFVARAISSDPKSAINLIAVALLGMGIASSVGRVAYITIQHYSHSGDVKPDLAKNEK
jgi:hypothetical protein